MGMLAGTEQIGIAGLKTVRRVLPLQTRISPMPTLGIAAEIRKEVVPGSDHG